ncbi:MAG: hypothetical protein M3Y53_04840 [Thermoproteota archaeon]|nr:hypothetical protein [Thermoproteota archaeon]
MLAVGNIVNTNVPSTSYKVGVTTKTSSTIINGPTSSSTFSVKQIGTGDIANGGITVIPPINGRDLTVSNSHSIIIVEVTNSGLTTQDILNGGGTECHV